MIADRNFNDPEPRYSAFQYHFDCPTVGRLFEHEPAEYFYTCSAEWSKIADPYVIKNPDQESSQPVTQHGVPRQCPANALLPQARTQCYIRAAINDRGQKKWQLIWSIAIVAV